MVWLFHYCWLALFSVLILQVKFRVRPSTQMMTKELRLLMHLNCSMCDRTTGSSPNPQDFLHTMGKNAELLGIYPMIKREVMTEKKKIFVQLYNNNSPQGSSLYKLPEDIAFSLLFCIAPSKRKLLKNLKSIYDALNSMSSRRYHGDLLIWPWSVCCFLALGMIF